MGDLGSDLLICIGLLVCGAVIIGGLVRLLRMVSTIECPRCGRREGHEVGSEKIPGTERRTSYQTGPGAPEIVLFAKYRVSYKCQHCGHRWEKKMERRVS
jgi:DNA-directed RNA polymerase subunit RPC12/RpoP